MVFRSLNLFEKFSIPPLKKGLKRCVQLIQYANMTQVIINDRAYITGRSRDIERLLMISFYTLVRSMAFGKQL